jgi:hypothetical protein
MNEQEIGIHIVNAIALDPGKVYILEADKTKVSSGQLERLLHYLHEQGIHSACLRTIGGNALRIVEPTQEEKS